MVALLALAIVGSSWCLGADRDRKVLPLAALCLRRGHNGKNGVAVHCENVWAARASSMQQRSFWSVAEWSELSRNNKVARARIAGQGQQQRRSAARRHRLITCSNTCS